MPSYSDIYVISEKRDQKTVEEFLNEFLPERDETADEYEFPQYSESSDVIFSTAKEALVKCINERDIDYRIYWRALNEAKPEHAMVFFLADGHVIYGVSTDDAYPKYAAELLLKLQSFLGSGLGYIGHEASPDAESLEEFKREIAVHQP
ncbi:hypothetical protein [Shewanella phaeophyticola]|uniref:Uncharacterized protein n=1 Tax=Shewanella phaeophyticola TaxID=2978345 RepID=A0ABT2P0V5_9GAMM|nr:hypothetical protein [Shewanella sp. KJ10-1]MCT8985946.1 hypothetical protein [Shewanella sp. KJ10-1]MCT8986278.1 hypothetical protein [Shewanella sp. KJ10-1]